MFAARIVKGLFQNKKIKDDLFLQKRNSLKNKILKN